MPSTNGLSATQQLTTSNGSAQTIIAHTVPEVNSSGWFQGKVVCRRLSDGATKVWFLQGSYKRGTGNASIESTLLGGVIGTTGDLLALLTANVTMDASGDDIRMRVTGLAGTDIIWIADLQGNELVEDP